MQGQINREITNLFQGAVRQTHFGFRNFKTLGLECFRNVAGGDGAEQTTIHARFLGNLHGHAVDLFATRLCLGMNFSLNFFEFGAPGFEFGQVGWRCALGFLLRDQKIAAIAILDFDNITQLAQVGQFSRRITCMISP